jgi:hypothetical protein
MKRVLALCLWGKNKLDAGVAKWKLTPSSKKELLLQGWDGGIAPPDSFRGGGGPGSFGNGILGREAPDAGSPRHHQAPSRRFHLASAGPDAGVQTQALPADAGSGSANPPPLVEKDTSIPIAMLHPNKTVNLKLQGTILADKHDDDTAGTSAHTALHTEKDLELGAHYANDDAKTITRITPSKGATEPGLPTVVLTFSIQTIYQKDADPAGPSAYGRGTVKDTDKKNGDTTLGFHESCHRKDLQQYAKMFRDFVAKHPFPEFKGKVGMSLEDFRQTKDKFLAPADSKNQGEVDKFVSGLLDYMLEQSGKLTDEVGNKLSDYCKTNPGDAECVKRN